MALCLLSCWTGPATSHASLPSTQSAKASRLSDIVVVLTWDGVRWQEIVHGIDPQLERRLGRRVHDNRSPAALVPNLYGLASSDGVLLGRDEAPIFASSPSTISLPGYSEIFSGRSPWCGNNDCPATRQPTLLDQWQMARPGTSMAVITSWSRIPRVAARDLAAISVSSGTGADDYRPDRATAAIALAYLQAHTPDFTFIGLGDTDEYAHHGDYDGYLSALSYADETLGAVQRWLDMQRRRGHRTLLIVTADHGRSSGFAEHSHAPEAARVWALFAGSVVTARGRPSAAPSRLADIAPTIREFVGLEPDSSPTAGTSLGSRLSPAGAADVRLASISAAGVAPSGNN